MTDPDYTHLEVVLDRSGSMQDIKSDTEGGFNAFLAEQKELPGRCTIALSQFDDVYEVVYWPTDIQQVSDLVLRPRGSTALLDAMGKSMTAAGEFLAGLDEDQRPGKVIVVVITDGMENASRGWTREQVFALVMHQTETYGWEFRFLAANQDAIAVGASFGVTKGSAMTYDSAHVGASYSSLSASVAVTRGGGSGAFTQEQRDAAAPSAK